MRSGQGRGLWRAWGPGLVLGLLAGCAAGGPPLDRALLADGGMGPRCRQAGEAYRIGCPDVLEVTVGQRPELSGRRRVGPDGRIDAGRAGRVRVEGQTVAETAATLA